MKEGLYEINLERDEILSKVIKKWGLPFLIPPDLPIPKDMVEQLRVGLPLLERQLKRLKDLIDKYTSEKNKHLFGVSPSIYPRYSKNNKECKNQVIISPKEPISIQHSLNIDPVILFNKLKKFRITAYEAKDLYYFLKYHTSELYDYGLNIECIKKAASKALGYIDNSGIRKWLVEIEYYKSI